jgi:hypothetical protein
METVGAVVSGAASVVNVWSLLDARLPEASLDFTRKWYVVDALSPESPTEWDITMEESSAVDCP